MDPLTHATLGACAALAVAPASYRRVAVTAGVGAGMLPDADIFIRSQTDPLLAIEYHRHFTHSFLLQPLLAALVVAVIWGLLRLLGRRRIPFGALYPSALAAGLVHVVCDAWTSYGTRVWWPFSDLRVAWDWTSVIDPIFTLVLITLGLIAFVLPRSRWRFQWWPWLWAILYLSAAVVQQQRAAAAVEQWVASEKRQPERIRVKPSFGNILVWRAIVDEGTSFTALAVRPGWDRVALAKGDSVARLKHDPRLPPAPLGDVQSRDLERFRHFSDNWLSLAAVGGGGWVVGDVRYAASPLRLVPLWGIRIDPGHPEAHANWTTFRNVRSEAWEELWGLIRGKLP